MYDKTELMEMVGGRTSAYKLINAAISRLNKLEPFVRWVGMIGMAVFIIMVVFTFFDVVLRYFFNRPIVGSIEITELMMAIVVFTGVAYTQLTRDHVSIDLITSRLKPKPRLIMDGFGNLISVALFVLVIWRTAVNAILVTDKTLILEITTNPFAALVPFGSILLLLLLLRDFLKNLAESLKSKGSLWLLVIGLPILVIAAAAYLAAAQPFDLSLPIIGVIGVVLMLLFFATGTPVAFVLMGLGLVMIIYIRGASAGFEILGTAWFRIAANYNWSPLMLFMLMGYLCFVSGLGEDLFRAANRFMGHLRGGLAMGTVAACTAFGAVVGDVLSGSIAMTAVGLPEMRRYKYDDNLAIGTLACSGTLGVLIPPSVGFIIYSILAEQSIGELFIAGIVPGLICASLFMFSIYLRCRANPMLGPVTPRSNWKDRLSSLQSGGPIGLLFLIVIGGIYTGIFTASEGGGIGAFCVLVVSLAMRRLNWQKFTGALFDAAKYTAMCFTLLGGAMVFGYFVAISKLPYAMSQFVAAMPVPPIVILIAMIIILFILGCILPALPMILITVPIFLPVATTMGWDLVWFGVIIVLMFNMANITPPFGINLFVMKGLTGSSLGLIFRSALPFVLMLTVTVIIIVAFPVLSTWLPYLMR